VFLLTYLNTCMVWCDACLLRLNGLVMRFEAPDSRNRWDSPVFTVHASESIPCDDIHQVLYHRQPPPPNLSTLPVSRELISVFAVEL